ncbi:putative cell morphogenesis protein las1 [Erysiphe neolycopersici]|uniref:Putative cell morphogenesis protein las1 n=1 Tax=Erysiphe neolycopersici TaxID=212602 RepID=A0A420I6R5_9PEZI|nr:putative cell morphogenesis protein las1 [Erysiphe neolycopersici]
MNSTSFDYSREVPYIDLTVSCQDMSFPKKPNTCRKYPQLSIPPSHSLNRVSKLPSPQKRSSRKMASVRDDKALLMSQVLQQQQQQQQHQVWNTQFSTNEYHHRQQCQAAPSTSCRPSSWHCPTLEPLQYMTPVSTTTTSLPPYPCNNSNLTPNNSSCSSSNNNDNTVSPEISPSSPLLSPAFTTSTDSLLSRDWSSPLQIYSNPAAMFESHYPLTDKPWIFDSLPQNNYFIHSPLTRDEHDYFQWNMNSTPSDYFLVNCSLTSPPTPNDAVQCHISGYPYLAEKSVSNHSLAKDQSAEEEELVGMGLYDCPESQKSPMFHHLSLDHITEVQGIRFVQSQAAELQGKGLKLEETFTPTLGDDDSVIDDDDECGTRGGGGG